MIFLRINLLNVMHFKEYEVKSGPRTLLCTAKFFTTVNINSLNTIYSQESMKFGGRAAQCTCTKAQVIQLHIVTAIG